MGIIKGFYRAFRHLKSSNDEKWISGYDFPGEELTDLNQRRQSMIYTQVLDLTTAVDLTNPTIIRVPGVAACIYGINSSNAYNPGTNTGLEQSEPSAFVACRINNNIPENFFPLKHNRGYIGTFRELVLTWPAQDNTYARLVVYKYDARPWINGEFDNRFGATVQGTKVTNETAVTLLATTNTQLLPVNTKRKCTTIYNTSTTATVYLGATGATTNGVALLPGGTAYWKNTAALFAYSSGTPTLNMITET